MYISVRGKYQLFLPDFKELDFFLSDFREILKY